MPITLDGTLGITTPSITVTGASTYTGDISTAGNLIFTTTGDRIIGDMSNATLANRLMFQTSTANSNSILSVIPSGTATTTAFQAFNNSDPTNASQADFRVSGSSDVRVSSTSAGSGTYLPLTFYTGGSERMRIDTSGNVGIGTSSPTRRLHLAAPTTCDMTIQCGNTTDYSYLYFGDSASATQAWVGYYNTEDSMRFGTNGAERMRIDSSGNVGIGTSSPTSKLTVFESNPTRGILGRFQNNAGSSLTGAQIQLSQSTVQDWAFGQPAGVDAFAFWSGRDKGSSDGTERMRIDSSGNVLPGADSTQNFGSSSKRWLTINGSTFSEGGAANNFITTSSTSTLFNSGSNWQQAIFYTGGTERMRIDSSGRFLFNTTTVNAQMNLSYAGNSIEGFRINDSASSSGSAAVRFQFGGTGVGGITLTGSTTSYNTSSDYRLKENIEPMTGALATVSALKPVTYQWKVDGSSGQGFIAHELQAVVPDCVVGEKDAVDANGNPKYQGVDTSFLVATLTAAIQELKSELDSVKAELQILKGI
jgi:hypothetical protein